MTNAEWLADIWNKHHKIITIIILLLFISGVIIEIITNSIILLPFVVFLGFIFLAVFTFELIKWLDAEHKERNK